MHEGLISIGKMAKINHVSINTLRLYDKWGLLTPIYIDEDTGYRYYDMKQNARLDLIGYMKELGMNLKEIKELLDKEDPTLIEAILIKKQRSIEKEMDDILRKRDAIKRTIYSLERYRKSPTPGTLTNEVILKEFKDQLLEEHLPQVYYCNVGTFLKRKRFLKQEFITHDIFIFVDEHFPKKESVQTLESGMYACIYMDDFNNEKKYAGRLLKYCMDNNYEVIGDYICEVLIELTFFKDNERSMYLRLQVPIAYKKVDPHH